MSGWTDERVEVLKKLWAEGLSAGQIAGRLGGVTRNACISKIHRLGLSGRATVVRLTKPDRPRRPRPAKSAETKKAVAKVLSFPTQRSTEPEADLVIPEDERRTVATLESCDCRWPFGDPQLADFHFCGRKKVQGFPYCEFHARRAFEPRGRKPAREPVNTGFAKLSHRLVPAMA